MLTDHAAREAVASRDPRFDGRFVHAVTSTGIYCRPSCPARTPRPEHSRFFPSAAAAQGAGFRACKRCRPDAAPGSPEWDVRTDTVARAVRLVADGVVDRDGVPALATALGYSVRQLERLLRAELGAGPLALAQAQRAQTARTLVESSDLPMADVAFAAGFSSVRSFNEVLQATYGTTPTALRAAARTGTGAAPGAGPSPARAAAPGDRPAGPATGGAGGTGGTGARTATLALRLAFRAPLEPSNLLGHLVATAVPGVEEYRDGAYRSTVRLPHAWGVVAVHAPADDHVPVTLHLADVRDLPAAVRRTRRLLDLDADPVAVDEALARDPHLRPLVEAVPGRRVPHHLDPEQMALRAVLGQQVSTAAARTHAARLVAALGTPVADPAGGLTHLFPSAAELAARPDEAAGVLRVPASRQRTFAGLAAALADGRVVLDAGADRRAAEAALTALPGIGPWTVGTIAMRALGDPDAFLVGDLGVRASARLLGLPDAPRALERAAAAWAPWRAYAVQHLWALSPHAVNALPGQVAPPSGFVPAHPSDREDPVPA
ncbi:AlkA N-terminal domain-containing protein [Cellulomonas endophytica]|uniref:AlkA N-terminal domain-containing protein n=1 Tax=Cellulomonas endophytica TaxID=2494735 RepID=UPI0010134246|nr:AlkA N-terminal domain-containing protein [Cellulomonas endophytica]